MKKCKCLMCGGVFDLPQPKSCPACGGMKFQSYFVKDPASAKPVSSRPAPAPKPAPAAVPSRTASVASKAAGSAGGRTAASPSAPVKKPTGLMPKKARSAGGSSLSSAISYFRGFGWRDWLHYLTRFVALVCAGLVFYFVFMLSAAMLNGWYWGVAGLVALIVLVKFKG